jgi:hypothetical protein
MAWVTRVGSPWPSPPAVPGAFPGAIRGEIGSGRGSMVADVPSGPKENGTTERRRQPAKVNMQAGEQHIPRHDGPLYGLRGDALRATPPVSGKARAVTSPVVRQAVRQNVHRP